MKHDFSVQFLLSEFSLSTFIGMEAISKPEALALSVVVKWDKTRSRKLFYRTTKCQKSDQKWRVFFLSVFCGKTEKNRVKWIGSLGTQNPTVEDKFWRCSDRDSKKIDD